MADEKKFLDAGGLGHAWDKIKTWLASWKTEQFGSGTYENELGLNIKEIETGLADAVIGSIRLGDFQVIYCDLPSGKVPTLEKPFGMLIRTGVSAGAVPIRVAANNTGKQIWVIGLIFNPNANSDGSYPVTMSGALVENGEGVVISDAVSSGIMPTYANANVMFWFQI